MRRSKPSSLWTAALLSVVACSASPASESPKEPADAAPPVTDEPPAVSGGGRPLPDVRPTSPSKVCGGAVGDGTGLRTVSWRIVPQSKYRIGLGAGLDASSLLSEPYLLSSTRAPAVTGKPSVEAATVAIATTTPLAASFVEAAAPETDLGMRRLGFSEHSRLAFDAATKLGPPEAPAYRLHVSAQHVRQHWSLSRPAVREESAREYYVSRLAATAGASWLLSIRFDHECKGEGLDELLDGRNPWAMSGVPRATVEQFLVANKASFHLFIVHTGPLDRAMQVAVEHTTCGPSDLGACAEMFDELEAARKALYARPLTAFDYDKLVTDGNVGGWIIGQIEATPIDSLR